MEIQRILITDLGKGLHHAGVVVDMGLLGVHILNFKLKATLAGYTITDNRGTELFNQVFGTLAECDKALHDQTLFVLNFEHRLM